jgi:hypothetical protein
MIGTNFPQKDEFKKKTPISNVRINFEIGVKISLSGTTMNHLAKIT